MVEWYEDIKPIDVSIYEPGTVIFATHYCEEGIEEAKEYCKFNKLTPEQVSIVKVCGKDEKKYETVLVKVK